MRSRRGLPWQMAMAHAIRLVVWLKHVKISLSLHIKIERDGSHKAMLTESLKQKQMHHALALVSMCV